MKGGTLDWNGAESTLVNVRRVLPDLVRDYFKSGRKLDSDSTAKNLHGFRLKTKRLRYTLEAFDSYYGPGLQPKVAGLRPIQNALGDLNDCEVLLSSIGKKLPDEVRAWVKKRADEKLKEFLRYWREEFDADGEDRKWEMYLTRATRRKVAQ